MSMPSPPDKDPKRIVLGRTDIAENDPNRFDTAPSEIVEKAVKPEI